VAIFSRLRRLIPKRSKSTDFDDRALALIADRYPQYAIGYGSYGDLEVLWQNTPAVLRMGAYCSVARGAQVFLGGEHRPDWVTTYPFTAISKEYPKWPGYPHTKGDVTIGNDVWICHEAVILSGVTVGDGAVIGARALVAKDVPPYAVVSGNPARIVRMRFSDDVIARLLTIRWWDWPQDRIIRALPMLLSADMGMFLDKVESGAL
jgi:chloramphenicol O-acetyltransferase type B